MAITAYLLLGSNLGDRAQYLSIARQQISRLIGPVITTSSIYKTGAWGKTNQPDFYNQVLAVKSTITPLEALRHIHSIENEIGRKRTEKWGERIIDIDILLWGNIITNSPDLVIPHPGIPERRFTLEPLVEIASDQIHPLLGKTMTELLNACKDKLKVEKINSDL